MLRTGGRLVLGLRFTSAAAARSFPASYGFYSQEQVRALLEQAAGFVARRPASAGLRDGWCCCRPFAVLDG